MTPSAVTEAAVPRLGVGVRLHHDAVRDTWGLLAPERLFKLDAQATEIMKLVDGQRSVAGIVDSLVVRYHAPRDVIARDVCAMLQGLADKNVVHA
ncbi:MAG: pyrroloquinoline quinone biosynthesis peptide chaperone PqqD [Nevskiaceae bacterium]|nr:MAG: pyrroloquinoline quinone biosynthesis peptide chaperone PqqD [Nevskiaceae bacterium]TBR73900.1 MAG: pyrroloquinoline quinone biosynthesis peptide chaperone PqqD [Nevskiaceae bacterium]